MTPVARALVMAVTLIGMHGAVQVRAAERWAPSVGATWDLQFVGPVEAERPVAIRDLDLFDTPAALVGELRRRGVRVICYLSAGTVEEWRPDAKDLAADVVGEEYPQWPGERWLDIRRIDAIAPVMERRLEL